MGALAAAQFGLLAVTGLPEVILTEDQNKSLAQSLQRVARHYPSILTEKQQDIAQLAVCVGSIAFAQTMAYRKRTGAK